MVVDLGGVVEVVTGVGVVEAEDLHVSGKI